MRRFLSAVSLTILLSGVAAVAQVQPQFNNPIDRVVAAGLMQRDASGAFQADAVMSRAELASILVRTFRLGDRTPLLSTVPALTDVSPSHWAYDDIQTVIRTGVMTGYREGQFYPEQRLTRAEAFSIFAQAYGVTQLSDEAVNEILAQHPDADQLPSWSRKSMATALYAGFVNLDSNAQIRPSFPMTRADMVYALDRFLSQAQEGPVTPGY